MEDLNNLIFGDNQNTPSDILNRFFETENIEGSTRVNIKQIKTLIQLKWVAGCKRIENTDKPRLDILLDVLDYYLRLKVSLKGQSRKEVLEGLKSQSLNQPVENSLLNIGKKE